MPLRIGYYETTQGAGRAAQAAAITNAGHTPVLLTSLSDAALASVDAVLIENINNSGYPSYFLSRVAALTAAVNNGLILIMVDWHMAGAAQILPGGAGYTAVHIGLSDVNFLNDAHPVATGPGGSLNDQSLDGGTASAHGYATGPLPTAAVPVLNYGSNPSQVTEFHYTYGQGFVYFSSVPWEYYASDTYGSSGATMFQNAAEYKVNVISFAASFADATVVLDFNHVVYEDHVSPSYHYTNSPITEDGFLIDNPRTTNQGEFGNFVGDSIGWSHGPGTPYVPNWGASEVRVGKISGSSFSLTSAKFDTRDDRFVGDVIATGTRADGSTVTTTLDLDTVRGLQLFTFSGFTDLVSVLFTGPVNFQFDDIVVTTGIAADTPAVANDDDATTTESASFSDNVFEDNGGGADSDADGDAFSVTSVNGDATKVGQQVTLPSGALLTLNADGTYTYDPNGAFDYLVSPATAAATGATNGSATDSFTYTIDGGDTATVTITITGEDDAGDRLMGDGGDNDMGGTPNADIFDLSQGGDDSASGLEGRDVFYFGATFGAGDGADGGGNADIVILQGDYGAPPAQQLRAAPPTSLAGITNLGNLGSISLFSHTNNLYGGQDPTPNSYNLLAADENVGAGQILKINGSSLAAGEDLTFDGSAESDGSFWIYGGKGTDTLTGGAKNDTFIFGVDGRLTAGDSIEGGGGYDLMILRGDYSLNLLDPAYAGMISGIESITLISAADTTYATGGDGEFDYTLVFADDLLAAGVTLTVNGSRLGANETMYFDGAAETGGHFRLWGGAADDFLAGGAGNDLIYGGLGADSLIGGGGADTFRYQATAESTAAAADMITGFQAGIDKIDLSRIDANVRAEGDQAFRWVGLAAFSGQGAGSAGELRMVAGSAGEWRIEGDTNGDGVADLVIDFNGTPIITFGDFIP